MVPCSKNSSYRPCISEMGRPALLVLAAPHLRGLRIVLDFPVRWVEIERPVHFPGDIGKLKHGDSDIADPDGSVELLSLANRRDEVGKMGNRHVIDANQVGG